MKKYRFITACLLILLAFLLFNIFNRNRNSTIETFNADAATKEEITDELVIALFIEEITNAVTNFYSEYYSGEIAVYDYEIAIVDIGKKEPGKYFSQQNKVCSQFTVSDKNSFYDII